MTPTIHRRARTRLRVLTCPNLDCGLVLATAQGEFQIVARPEQTVLGVLVAISCPVCGSVWRLPSAELAALVAALPGLREQLP